LPELIEPLLSKGLRSVLVFGVLTEDSESDESKKKCLQHQKDASGSVALSNRSPVALALRLLSRKYPSLLLIADVCICAYTAHGHCGLLNADGYIDNARSIQQIASVAVHYARHGAHIVAPSDMMDGRTKQIKAALHAQGLSYRCSVMSYSSKYCSSFYGPFRDACHSAPSSSDEPAEERTVCKMKDRSSYQLPIGARGLGIRASLRCADEGADFLMVKPGLAYLDIIRDVRQRLPHIPLAVYQVSGEYAMIWWGAHHGAFDLKEIVLETCVSFKRAGAGIIISYYTPRILEWIADSKM